MEEEFLALAQAPIRDGCGVDDAVVVPGLGGRRQVWTCGKCDCRLRPPIRSSDSRKSACRSFVWQEVLVGCGEHEGSVVLSDSATRILSQLPLRVEPHHQVASCRLRTLHRSRRLAEQRLRTRVLVTHFGHPQAQRAAHVWEFTREHMPVNALAYTLGQHEPTREFGTRQQHRELFAAHAVVATRRRVIDG